MVAVEALVANAMGIFVLEEEEAAMEVMEE